MSAYRALARRDQEDELRRCSTTSELRDGAVASAGYQEKKRDPTVTNSPTLVIAEIGEGLRLWLDVADRGIGLNILRGRYELNELDFLRRVARPGDSVVDLGAHVGYFAIHLARLVGPGGCVTAFEPVDENVECLQRSVRENGFGDRVFVERAAAAERNGTPELACAPATNSGGAFLLGNGSVPAGYEVRTIRTVSLDEHPLRRPVALIKADVEGAEALAFRGAEGLLRDDRPIVLADLDPLRLEQVSGTTASAFIAEMERHRYACHVLGAGEPGRRISDAPSNGVTPVVFLNRAGRRPAWRRP